VSRKINKLENLRKKVDGLDEVKMTYTEGVEPVKAHTENPKPPSSDVERAPVLAGADVRDIPIDQIRFGLNARQINATDPDILELADSLERVGLIHAIRVGVVDGGYQLIAGERRVRAAQHLGWKHIRAEVVNTPPDQWDIEMAVENLQRKNFEPWEEAQLYQRWLDRGWSIKDISLHIGKSLSYVSVVVKLNRHASIRAALESRAIPSLSLAQELTKLIDADGNEVVPGVVDQAIAHIQRVKPTVVELREWIRETLTQPQNTAVHSRRVTKRTKSYVGQLERFLISQREMLTELSSIERQGLRDLYAAQIDYIDKLHQHEES